MKIEKRLQKLFVAGLVCHVEELKMMAQSLSEAFKFEKELTVVNDFECRRYLVMDGNNMVAKVNPAGFWSVNFGDVFIQGDSPRVSESFLQVLTWMARQKLNGVSKVYWPGTEDIDETTFLAASIDTTQV